jgi:hypothetical protein
MDPLYHATERYSTLKISSHVIEMSAQASHEITYAAEGVTVEEPHRWKTIDDVIVSFTIPGRIPDAAWDAFLDDIVRQRPRYCLVLCLGRVEVDAAQRRRSTQAVMRTRTQVLVITDNRMTRGLAMAVAWFGAKLDAHPWSHVDAAVRGLDLSAETRERLLQETRGFYETLGYIDR